MLRNSPGTGAFTGEGKALFYGADGAPLPVVERRRDCATGEVSP